MKKTSQKSIERIAIIGMLSAVSFVLFLYEIPLVPSVSFLKLDLSDIPALFAGVVYGPWSAVIIELLKNVIELIFKGFGSQMGFGNLMNFIVGCAFTVPFSILFSKLSKKDMTENKALLLSGIISLIVIVVLGIGANFVIAPLFFKYFMGVTVEGETLYTAVATATILNFIKGVMLCIVSFPMVKVLIKRVGSLIK